MPDLFLSILDNLDSIDNHILKANKTNYKGTESHYSHFSNLISAYKQKYVHTPEKTKIDYRHICDVEDKEDELNIFMIQSCHFYTIEREISKNYLDLNFISKQTISLLKEFKNFFIWVVDDKEGSYDFEPQFRKNILNFLDSNNINRSKFIFSNCNNFINKKINFVKSFPINPYILQGTLDENIDCNGNIKSAPSIFHIKNQKEKIRPYKFLCYNRNSSRLHRLLLVSKLFKDNILDECMVSLYENEYFNDIDRDDLFYSFEGLEFSYVDVIWMKKILNEKYPLRLDFDNQQSAAQSDNFLSESSHYLDTYFSLVTETSISNDWCFITEKCIRPMVGMQPFIVFGNPHTLKTLKTFGFKTFDKIIDESYDNEFDTNIRFELAYNEVKKLNNMPIEELHKVYHSIMDILEHNKNLIRELAHSDGVIDDTISKLIECVSKNTNFVL